MKIIKFNFNNNYKNNNIELKKGLFKLDNILIKNKYLKILKNITINKNNLIIKKYNNLTKQTVNHSTIIDDSKPLPENYYRNKFTNFNTIQLINYKYSLKKQFNIIYQYSKLNTFTLYNNQILPLIILNELEKRNYTYIHVAQALNKNIIGVHLLSMNSIMYNCKKDHFIIFYLLIPNDFSNNEQKLIIELYKKYYNLVIIFVNMENTAKGLITNSKIPTVSYYRLFISKFIGGIKRIIYLDSDIIVYKDLLELYSLEMNNSTVMGRIGPKECYKIGKPLDFEINAGILLINAENHVKRKMYNQFEIFFKKGLFLDHHDNTALNYYLGSKGEIGLLHIKWNFFFNVLSKEDMMKEINDLEKNGVKINYTEFKEATNDPYIIHFHGYNKPWDINFYNTRFKCFGIRWLKEAEKYDLLNIYFKNLEYKKYLKECSEKYTNNNKEIIKSKLDF